MNPHSDRNQTKAAYQAQRRANPVVRILEQSANTVQRANARTNQGVQEHDEQQQERSQGCKNKSNQPTP